MVKCCVPSCKEQFGSKFSIPKDKNLLDLWEKSLNLKLNVNSKVCELHFESGDILKTWESGQGISKYTVCKTIKLSYSITTHQKHLKLLYCCMT